jgi:hypothetical protein
MKLIDYKGKYSIATDAIIDDFDIVIGEISKEDLIKQIPERVEACTYYGIPVYIGEDKDIKDLIQKEYEKLQ